MFNDRTAASPSQTATTISPPASRAATSVASSASDTMMTGGPPPAREAPARTTSTKVGVGEGEQGHHPQVM